MNKKILSSFQFLPLGLHVCGQTRFLASMNQVLVDFSEETTAHTVRQIFDTNRKTWARVVWFFMLSIGSTFFIYQTIQLTCLYLSYPTSVTTSLMFSPLEFPSITFCNNNPLKNSLLDNVN